MNSALARLLGWQFYNRLIFGKNNGNNKIRLGGDGVEYVKKLKKSKS